MLEAKLGSSGVRRAASSQDELPSCCVLVVSCDSYSDLWRPFFTLLWRHWPDCPFPVYLGTNSAEYQDERVSSLNVGPDESWSKNLRYFLNQMDSKYVLLLLEDFFLTKRVATDAVVEHLKILDTLGGTVMRLYPNPPPEAQLKGVPGVGIIHRRAKFRVSAQGAIWNRADLLALIRDEESPWDFELRGSERSRTRADGYFSTFKPVLGYLQGVEQGRWFWYPALRFRREGIGCDFGARPVMPAWEAGKKATNRFRKRLLHRARGIGLRLSDWVTNGEGRRPERMSRIVFLTNFIPPYNKPVLDILAQRHGQLRVLLSTPMETNRSWAPDWGGLDVVVQRTLTVSGKWRHPRGFNESTEVHFPYDTIAQLKKYSPDVVISTEMGFRTMAAILYTKLHRQARVIVWTEVTESTEQGRGRVRKFVRRWITRHAHGFLALGTNGVRYVESLGAPAKRIFKLAYATDAERFRAEPVKDNGNEGKRVLYVGQLIERKGLTQFIAALSRWAQSHPEQAIELVLAGDGPLGHTLKAVMLPGNLRISFLGNINYKDLPRVYAGASLFAFPTLADTWGMVVNEAMAAGLPVLGSVYSQAVEEMVMDGVNGWTFRPDDSEEMYRALDRALSSSPEALNHMRASARRTALKLTPAHVADLIQSAVHACLNDSEEREGPETRVAASER